MIIRVNHELKLQPRFFDYIDKGTKRIELRLYDEKRQQIQIGDIVRFKKEPELNEIIDTRVVGLLRYNTFEELFKDFDIEILADKKMTKKQLLETLERFYTKDKQSKYGVVGIKIEKI